MGLEAFCGLCLLAAGPATVVYVAVIARKSFLVLLTLARQALVSFKDGDHSKLSLLIDHSFTECSAFYWLIVLPDHLSAGQRYIPCCMSADSCMH